MEAKDHLLDTNVLLFFLEDSPRLPSGLAELIENPNTQTYVSLMSLWEIAIKASLGKLRVDYANHEDLPQLLTQMGFILVQPSWDAMRTGATLPQHHRDPFDRILIAEAQTRGVPILSCDSQLDAYEVERIW